MRNLCSTNKRLGDINPIFIRDRGSLPNTTSYCFLLRSFRKHLQHAVNEHGGLWEDMCFVCQDYHIKMS